MSATVIPHTIPVSPFTVPALPHSSGALVMAADYRGLGVVRSLGRRGIPVWLLRNGGHLVATTSRYLRRSIPWPPAAEEEHVERLVNLAAKNQLTNWMLFPTDDYAVGLVSRYHNTLAQSYRLTVPPWDQLRLVCDKRALHELAGRLHLGRPWATAPTHRDELQQLNCPFPVILKPATRLRPNTMATPKAWRVDDRETLLSVYDQASALVGAENLLVQEIVPGGGETQFSFAALCSDGSPLASVVARRTRQYPIDFGQFSTFVETVDEPGVVEPAVQLLKALRVTGLTEVEFKKDPRDGEFKILDVNPRVWGWHTIARRDGLDFPYLLWRLMNGETIPDMRARSGQTWIHMAGDLPSSIRQVLRGRLSLRTYLRGLQRPRESALFAWDDPAPGILDLPLFACSAVKRLFQKTGS